MRWPLGRNVITLDESGDWYQLEKPIDDAIACDTCDFALVAYDKAVAQDIVRHRCDIIGTHKITAGKPGVCASARIPADGCPRAGTLFNPGCELLAVGFGLSRRNDELHDVLFHRFRHVDIQDGVARLKNSIGRY